MTYVAATCRSDLVRRRIRLVKCAMLVCAVIGAPRIVRAQAPSAGAASREQTGGSTVPLTGGWQDGFVLQTPDQGFRLQFGMVSQTDGRFLVDDPGDAVTDTLVLRKLRPTFTGRVARFFEFKFMPDFGNGAVVVQDAYVDLRFSNAFRFRAGKDKTPVGLELLQGDAFLWFPERSLASSLVPNRDVGLQVQGDVLGDTLFYAAGVFNGIPDGTSSTADVDVNGSKDVAGRFVLQPFRSGSNAAKGLGISVGGSSGRQRGPLPSFRTSVGQTYFSYDRNAAAAGFRHRLSPSFFYFYRTVGVFGEYMRSSQPVALGARVVDVTNHAWEMSGSVFLTGEPATDRGVRPIRPFDPQSGHWGALQVLARYTELAVDRRAFETGVAATGASRTAKSFTIAVNWFPVSYIKYYVTFERTVFGSDISTPRHAENAILFRLQLNF